MSNGNPPAYGLWSLVIINSLVFILFVRISAHRGRHFRLIVDGISA
jgi:hypothetical protein